jgi:glutamate/tyrosine decarboxylase-like PLP-dependent enzyme
VIDQLMDQLDPSNAVMNRIWQTIAATTSSYRRDVGELPVTPPLRLKELRGSIDAMQCLEETAWNDVIEWVDRHMRSDQLHASHPRYFGLFNPAPLPMSIAADALVAAYNPQLAAWSHSPFAVELEHHLIRMFGQRFGYSVDLIDGTFCTGGAEANHTALLCALTKLFPEFGQSGLRAISTQPVIFVTPSAHHSWIKAARACGLGSAAVRMIKVDLEQRMDIEDLVLQISSAGAFGQTPFMVCGTAGSTNAGIIDPLAEIATACEQFGVWFHVDAAWGGAAALVPDLAHWLNGIASSDSITFDTHKFLSIPMGAGLFLTRDCQVLSRCFSVSADYMPRDAADLGVIEPYVHSLQWSRRFIGLKVFLPLAVAGWKAIEQMIRRQVALGQLLREMLTADGWQCVNSSPLPVVCFVDENDPEGTRVEQIAASVVLSGQCWISPTRLGIPVLRACITNFRTQESDLRILIKNLAEARQSG